MVQETIIQHWIISQFILPFLLVWFVTFAILQKTRLLGEDKKQLDALTAAVLAAIFVGAVFPKAVVANMILFLTISMIVVFVGLLLWGFVSGSELNKDFITNPYLKWVVGIFVLVSVVLALAWASGINSLGILDSLFRQSWSQVFWTNVSFIVVAGAAIAWAVKKQ